MTDDTRSQEPTTASGKALLDRLLHPKRDDTPSNYADRILAIEAEATDASPFMREVLEARENGYDILCAECGTGIAGDGMELHVSGCSHA